MISDQKSFGGSFSRVALFERVRQTNFEVEKNSKNLNLVSKSSVFPTSRVS